MDLILPDLPPTKTIECGDPNPEHIWCEICEDFHFADDHYVCWSCNVAYDDEHDCPMKNREDC